MINLQKMWGSSGRVVFPLGNITVAPVTIQLADIRLPEPAVCSIFFQAYFAGGEPTAVLQSTTLDLVLGLGRAATTLSRTYVAQPSASVPLDVLLPDQPFHSLLVTVSARGNSGVIGVGSPLVITTIIQVAPVTRLHQKADPLSFGMALPGEAEGVDESTLEEAEALSPELVDEVRQIRDAQGSLMDIPEEPDDPDARVVRPPPARHALISRIIETLTIRHGERPSKAMVRRALQAHDSRKARR